MPKDFVLPFIKNEQVADKTYAFYFDRSDEDFSFLPGQYIRMTVPIEHPDNRGISRFFSLTSSPLRKDWIRIVTKVIQSTFKKNLLTLTPPQKIQFFGPVGNFYLRENEIASTHVLLAGGIGLTPFLSMLSYIDETKLRLPVVFIASFSKPEEVMFQKTLEELSQRNPSVRIIFSVSHPEESQLPWQGEKGRISEELIKKYVSDIHGSIFYLVGPPAMVSAMSAIVTTLGVAKERILQENFIGY